MDIKNDIATKTPLLWTGISEFVSIPEMVADIKLGWSDEDISTFILCLISESLDRQDEQGQKEYVKEHGLPLAEEIDLLCYEATLK